MEKLLIRHGLSEANDRHRPAFGSPDASLMYRGWFDAFEAGSTLEEMGVDIAATQVATSTMLRTKQTALGAGSLPENMTAYDSLDEVKHGLGFVTLRFMLDNRIYPIAALEAADQLLDSLPHQPVYFTHGLRISSVIYMANGHAPEPFIPKFGTISTLVIDDTKRQDLAKSIESMKSKYERLITEADIVRGVDPLYGRDS